LAELITIARACGAVFALLLIAGPFVVQPVSAETAAQTKPAQQIISLDYCADQYVLQFVERSRILALSGDAQKSFSYLRDQANGIPQIRPLTEDVLLAQPDLVVRSYGGGPNALGFFARSGVKVLQVGYADDLAGVQRVTLEMAQGLWVPAAGQALVAEINRRLAAIAGARNHEAERDSVLYMTTGGATSGPETLVHEMFLAAGLRNFQTQAGWRSLPLEQLAYTQPDRVALAQFNQAAPNTESWSAVRHPLAQQQLRTRPTTLLEGAWTACGAWFLLDAIEALAAGQASINPGGDNAGGDHRVSE